jgi:hypothetical protein
MDEDLIKRIYALPTRAELEHIVEQFVTKEVFNLKIAGLQSQINELKKRPANYRAIIGWSIGMIVSGIAIAGFLASHLSWK